MSYSSRVFIFGELTENEKKVLAHLDSVLPNEYKILGGLLVSDLALGEREYDFVVLGQLAVYVLEVKSWGGKIKGEASSWEIREKSGRVATYPSPFVQLRKQTSILVSRLKFSGLPEQIPLQGFICLSSEEQPELSELQDSSYHKRQVIWYKDAHRMLTAQKWLDPEIPRGKNLYPLHNALLTLFKTGFHGREVEQVPGFQITELAWEGRRYKAYFAKRHNAYPHEVLLKVYRVPESVTDSAEIKRFVWDLNNRDLSALRKIGRTGDQFTLGSDYVLAGESAFPLKTDERKYVVVTEWVNGIPLSNLLQSGEKISESVRCLMAAQMCRGLAFVHSANVIHRNLSADNIIWVEKENKIKIINFDFAKFIQKDDFATVANPSVLSEMQTELVYREKYQAPELRKGNNSSDKFPYHAARVETDVYSLGMILLELFSGQIYPDLPTTLSSFENSKLPDSIREIVQVWCSDEPHARMKISLLDAARQLEKQAGLSETSINRDKLPENYRLGIYSIKKNIKASGMSAVYLAQNVWTKQHVIIKIPRASLSQDAQNELMRAMQVMEDINPDYTARLLTTDIAFLAQNMIQKEWSSGSKEIYYQVWEYIDGETLTVYLDIHKDDGFDQRFQHVRKAIQIIAALHEKGWIHQDIKPDNFIVDKNGLLKVIDFGLTRHTAKPELGRPTGGTPGCYLPPEIQSGEAWTFAGDVWSLGCLTLVILFGNGMCSATGPSIGWEKKVQESLGHDFYHVLEQATSKNKENRYQNASQLLQFLEIAYQKPVRKKNMNVEKILATLKEELDYAIGTSDEARVAADRRLFEQWIQGGMHGKCPINLRDYDGDDEPDVIEETTMPAQSIAEPGSVQPITGQAKAAEPAIVGLETSKPEIIQPEIEQPEAGEQLAKPAAFKTSQSETSESPIVDQEEVARQAADLEHASLRRELERVREYISRSQWREALGLAETVEKRAEGDLKASARDLLEQARAGLNNALSDLLMQANAVRSAGESAKARELYNAILALERENSDARLALQEMDDLVQEQVSGQKLNELRAGLKERRDIKRLGDAVYDVEALDQEGRLPDELAALLKEARDTYDKTRLQMGEETTQMRFGDIEARAKAVADLQARVVKGDKYILDATTSSERPATEVLREAQALFEQASEDTAQYELSLAEKNKTLRPAYVRHRLQEALKKPFFEQHKRKLEEKLSEVERFLQAEERAAQLQEKALQAASQIEKLALLLQAQGVFPNLTGLGEQVAQVRPVALSLLQAEIDDNLRLAESLLTSEEFNEARQAVGEAEKEANTWPESQKPEEIQNLLHRAASLRARIDDIESAWKEYQKLSSRIRQQVSDPDQRGAGLSLFKQVSEDPRFKSFRDLRMLTSDVDQYKGAQEQLADAQTARANGDWSRVFEISDHAIKSGQAGALAGRFRELYEDAVTELNVARAQELLQSDDIPEANNILSATLNKERERDPKRETNLRERLKGDLERILQAIRATKEAMQLLFDEAVRQVDFFDNVAFKAFTSPSFALRQSRVGADGQVNNPEMRALINRLKQGAGEADPAPAELSERVRAELLAGLGRRGVQERLNALRRFRYVGGDVSVRQESWPDYALSLRTAEARRAARLLADSLRRDLLEPLKEKRNQFIGHEESIRDEDLRLLAEQAGQLRDANLLETEDERAAGRWAEVYWGRRQAADEEKSANWQGALATWHRLNNHYPGLPEVRRGLRNARIQHAINRAYFLVHNHHKGDEALTLLQELQSEPEMDNAWELNLALTDTYEALGNYDSAFGNLDQAARVARNLPETERESLLTSIGTRHETLESGRAIYTASEDARRKAQAGDYAEALRLLQITIQNPKVRDAAALRELRDELYERAASELLTQARQERDKGSNEGKILAVTALVDLQHLEDLMSLPDMGRRSADELKRLRSDLKPAAESAINEVRDFEPSILPLEQAIRRAGELVARLQTFDNVMPIFTAELETLRESLKKRASDMAETLKKLNELKDLLEQAAQPGVWESAVRMGDFDWLERQRNAIRKLGLTAMPEVRAFERRLDETREAQMLLMKAIAEIKNSFTARDKDEKKEDFALVKRRIIETSALPDLRENGERWQAVHARDYDDMRRTLSDRLRIPDVYGGNDMVGWSAVQEQAESRAAELERWQEWDRQCAHRLDLAAKALQTADSCKDDPHRIKLSVWKKVHDSAHEALQLITFTLETSEETQPVARVVGIPGLESRSRQAKDVLEEGKRRKVIAEDWLNRAEIEIDALKDLIEKRGFPTEREFSEATTQKDWLRLEKLLARAREAGITNETEQKRVDIYTRVLNDNKDKKSWWPF